MRASTRVYVPKTHSSSENLKLEGHSFLNISFLFFHILSFSSHHHYFLPLIYLLTKERLRYQDRRYRISKSFSFHFTRYIFLPSTLACLLSDQSYYESILSTALIFMHRVPMTSFNERDTGHREVKQVLERCKLLQYLDIFIAEGFDCLKSVRFPFISKIHIINQCQARMLKRIKRLYSFVKSARTTWLP